MCLFMWHIIYIPYTNSYHVSVCAYYYLNSQTIFIEHLLSFAEGFPYIISVILYYKVKWKSLSPVWFFATPWTWHEFFARLLCPWNSAGQNTGVGSHSFLQPMDWTQVSRIAGIFFTLWATREAQEYWSGYPIPSLVIFLTHGWNPGLLHCRWILCRLSLQAHNSMLTPLR